jgi:hypothetical protein
VHPLRPIEVIDEAAKLRVRISEVTVLGYIHLLFLNGPDQALGKAEFLRLPAS